MVFQKKVMRKIILIIIISLASISCKRNVQWGYEEFFEQTFKIIEEKSIKKYNLNWTDLKETVRDSIPLFNSNEDVYNAIGYAVKLIDDGHSIFISAQNPEKGQLTNALLIDTIPVPVIKTKIIKNDVGYINLPGFISNDSLIDKYALEIRKALISLDTTAELSGWVIDLRNNSGGKLPSEALGLSPLFVQPLIGISCDNKNTFRKIRVTNNYFYFGDYLMDSLDYNSTLVNKNKKIAILVSEKTVSGGEFLALAFMFQEDTKVFGSKTKGKTSHLRLFDFKSNAKLLLATDYYCDKNSNKITAGLVPDIECMYKESLSKAIEWIK
jgi:C-terminal processing protease CtpA/Prc